MFLTRPLLATLSLAASIIALPLQLSHEHAEFISTTLVTRAAHREFLLENTLEAAQLNRKFAGLSPSSSCVNDEKACVSGQLANCVSGRFVLTPCDVGVCSAVPLTNGPGVNITCAEPPADLRLAMSSISTPRVASPSLRKRGSPKAPPACPTRWENITSTHDKFVASSSATTGEKKWMYGCSNFLQPKKKVACQNLLWGKGESSFSANADPCVQQDNAVKLMNYAKSQGEEMFNRDMLMAAAREFASYSLRPDPKQHIPYSVPYCQRDHKVKELEGLFHTQMPDANPGLFRDRKGNVFAFGDKRSCPFGKKPNVKTCTCN